jgi:hypothetical protein
MLPFECGGVCLYSKRLYHTRSSNSTVVPRGTPTDQNGKYAFQDRELDK